MGLNESKTGESGDLTAGAPPPLGSLSQRTSGPKSPEAKKPTPPTGPKPKAATPVAAAPAHKDSLTIEPPKQLQSPAVTDSKKSPAAAAPAAPAPVAPAPEAEADAMNTRTKISGKLTVDDFELLTVVGKGSFGKVMQVRKKDTGKIFAMKVLKKKSLVARKQIQHTITERRVLEEIDHPFVVSLRYAFQTEDKLYMVLDYFTGGELFYHLKNQGRFEENRARLYAAEIILAIQCLHEKGIIYRDLKPENILLDSDGHIRLTDFGLSKECIGNDTLTHTFCGTPEYLAPEVLYGHGHGKAVDWWSLGTLLYEMLTGLPPFYNQNLHLMYDKILKAPLTFPSYMSESARSLLRGLIERDPKKRLGSGNSVQGADGKFLQDAEEIKCHPFFKDLDWRKVYDKQYEPIFKPPVADGDMTTTNVDNEFKLEEAKDTPVAHSSTGLNAKVQFPDFTYVSNDKGQIGQSMDEENSRNKAQCLLSRYAL